jgi:hypothetical protein
MSELAVPSVNEREIGFEHFLKRTSLCMYDYATRKLLDEGFRRSLVPFSLVGDVESLCARSFTSGWSSGKKLLLAFTRKGSGKGVHASVLPEIADDGAGASLGSASSDRVLGKCGADLVDDGCTCSGN